MTLSLISEVISAVRKMYSAENFKSIVSTYANFKNLKIHGVISQEADFAALTTRLTQFVEAFYHEPTFQQEIKANHRKHNVEPNQENCDAMADRILTMLVAAYIQYLIEENTTNGISTSLRKEQENTIKKAKKKMERDLRSFCSTAYKTALNIYNPLNKELLFDPNMEALRMYITLIEKATSSINTIFDNQIPPIHGALKPSSKFLDHLLCLLNQYIGFHCISIPDGWIPHLELLGFSKQEIEFYNKKSLPRLERRFNNIEEYQLVMSELKTFDALKSFDDAPILNTVIHQCHQASTEKFTQNYLKRHSILEPKTSKNE